MGKPYQRGFFCDDDTIRLPYKEDTVPAQALHSIGLGIPVVVVRLFTYIPVRTMDQFG